MREALGRIVREPGFYGVVVALAGIVGVGWADDLAGYPEGHVAELKIEVVELRDDGRLGTAAQKQMEIDSYDNEAETTQTVRTYGVAAAVLGGITLAMSAPDRHKSESVTV